MAVSQSFQAMGALKPRPAQAEPKENRVPSVWVLAAGGIRRLATRTIERESQAVLTFDGS